MPVKLVEVVVRSQRNSLHLSLQSRDSWMVVKENPDRQKKNKKKIAMNPGNHLVDNFCLRFLYLGSFCFCTSVYLRRALKPVFLGRFCYFWKDKFLFIFNLFISEYRYQVFPWKEMKEIFSVPFQTEKLCFCLR